MTAKNEVALTILDPGEQRWAQLVDLDLLVKDVVPLLVMRLGLPDKLQYDLVQVDSGHKLGASSTLAQGGVAAGALLQLAVVRNKVLADLLDALYKEAVDYTAEQLWGQAEARLELIKRLDPFYPDPLGVGVAIATKTAAAGAGSLAKGTQPGQSITSQATSQPASSGASSAGSATRAPSGGASSAAAGSATTGGSSAPANVPAAAAKGGVSGCLVLGIIVLALVVGAAFFAWQGIKNGIDLAGLPLVGEYFGGEEAGTLPTIIDEPQLGTGDVQVTLRWDNAADLDLHVIDPDGAEVYFSNPVVASGGQLDVDANGTCSGDPAVENVYWPTGGAPDGTYSVSVVYFGSCGVSSSSNYEVLFLVDGQEVDRVQGTLAESDGSHVIGNFTR